MFNNVILIMSSFYECFSVSEYNIIENWNLHGAQFENSTVNNKSIFLKCELLTEHSCDVQTKNT